MFRSLLIVAVLTGATSAQIIPPQPIGVTGVVRTADFGTDPILCGPASHVIECSQGIFGLTSTTLDLDKYVGQNVKLFGNQLGAFCPLYDVYEVDETPPATLDICGTEGLGCEIRLVSGPGGISQHFLLASVVPGFVNLGLETGVLLLGEPFVILASATGPIAPEGAKFDFVIPADANLIGVTVRWQAASRQVGPVGPLHLSNAICMEIIGFPIICHPADC